MRPVIRTILPDAGKEVTITFHPDERHVEIEWDADHYLDVMFDANGHLVASCGYPNQESIGHDPVGEVARLDDISPQLAGLVIVQLLELSASR